MKIEEAVREFLVECEIRKYTPKTIRGYRTALGVFSKVLVNELSVYDTDDISMAVVKKFTQVMGKRKRKGTYINSLLKVSKSFITYCYGEGLGCFDPSGRTFSWVKEDKAVIMAYKPKQVRLLLDNCKGNDFIDVRDMAIMTTFFETGIRCWELCCIRPEHIHEDYILITDGKNHKQRVVPISAPLKKALIRYGRARDNYFAYKNTDNYFFLSFHGRQLTNSGIEHIFKKEGQELQGCGVARILVGILGRKCRSEWEQTYIRYLVFWDMRTFGLLRLI